MSGRYDQRKKPDGPQVEAPESEQEEVGPRVDEAQQQNQRQNTLGNQAVAQLMNQGRDQIGEEGAGVEMLPEFAPHEKEGIQYGGDDDPVDDGGALTIHDLTRSWNPGARHTEDRPRFGEPMPDSVLPPEDPDFLAEVHLETPAVRPPAVWTADALVQPSEVVVVSSLRRWIAALGRWAGPSPQQRALLYATRHPPTVLQDPHGRVLVGRIRVATLGAWLLSTSPRLTGATASTAALAGLTLEIHGRAHRADNRQLELEASEERLPRATALYARWWGHPGGVADRALSPAAADEVATALRAVHSLTDPSGLVPDLRGHSPIADEDDDPLGIDDIIASHTGGRADPLQGAYQSAIQGAERLAAAAARTRIRFAATAWIVSEVCDGWTVGAPAGSLGRILAVLDQEIQNTLRLLVEVARAAQGRTVGLSGIRNGLTRAARGLVRIERAITERMGRAVGGVLPESPTLPPPAPLPHDPWSLAWGDRAPREALGFLHSLLPTPERELALLLTRASFDAPAALLPALADLEAAPVHVRGPAGVLRGACLLWEGRVDEALELADAQLELGRQRRSGLVVAEAALLAAEAHTLAERPRDATRARIEAGSLLWHMGARGPLSLLARWQPPEDDA